MRGSYHPCQLTHLLSVLLAAAAIVLTFLILFAGSKPNFMEDYAIITVDTGL
jgi:general stress protein CsbA